MLSTISKKYVMGLTGLFLISFLIVHCSINALIFVNDEGELFNKAAHFMSTNILIRIMEIGLFVGILLHIIDALVLYFKNRKSRPVAYEVSAGTANSKWYSRNMGILGSMILFFLVIHLAHFWYVSRFGPLRDVIYDDSHYHDLYTEMLVVFSNPLWVVVYIFSMIALAYHLMHGFQSAFQTLGFNHKKYTPIIKKMGFVFSVIVPMIFAAMPIFLYFIKK